MLVYYNSVHNIIYKRSAWVNYEMNMTFFFGFFLFLENTTGGFNNCVFFGQHDINMIQCTATINLKFYDREGIQEDRGQMQKDRNTRSWTWYTQDKTKYTLQRQV